MSAGASSRLRGVIRLAKRSHAARSSKQFLHSFIHKTLCLKQPHHHGCFLGSSSDSRERCGLTHNSRSDDLFDLFPMIMLLDAENAQNVFQVYWEFRLRMQRDQTCIRLFRI